MSGSINALAAIFIQEREPNGDEERDVIVSEYLQTKAFAVQKNLVIMKTQNGRLFAEKKIIQGCPIVVFDWYPSNRVDRVTFWFNQSSVKDIGDWLRAHPELRAKDATDFLTHY